jgi:hypothetical protein
MMYRRTWHLGVAESMVHDGRGFSDFGFRCRLMWGDKVAKNSFFFFFSLSLSLSLLWVRCYAWIRGPQDVPTNYAIERCQQLCVA